MDGNYDNISIALTSYENALTQLAALNVFMERRQEFYNNGYWTYLKPYGTAISLLLKFHYTSLAMIINIKSSTTSIVNLNKSSTFFFKLHRIALFLNVRATKNCL